MAAQLNILIVEDHHALRDATVSFLREHGHNVKGVQCAEDVFHEVMRVPIDIFVIDLNLPGEDGISLSQRIRRANPSTGIVMATARTLAEDRIVGYKSGADIYLNKPVEPEELLVCVEALGKRIKQAKLSGGLVLDLRKMALKGPYGSANLTTAEVNLLRGMLQAKNQTLERSQVLVELDIVVGEVQSNSMEARISKLRNKLSNVSGEDNCIKSIRGHGYKLCVHLSVS